MAHAMGTASKSMARVNAKQDPQKLAATMRDYQMQQEKMGMTQEMMDDLMEGDDDLEDEADAVVDEVFDELGVEIAGSVCILFYYHSYVLTFKIVFTCSFLCFCFDNNDRWPLFPSLVLVLLKQKDQRRPR